MGSLDIVDHVTGVIRHQVRVRSAVEIAPIVDSIRLRVRGYDIRIVTKLILVDKIAGPVVEFNSSQLILKRSGRPVSGLVREGQDGEYDALINRAVRFVDGHAG